MARRPPPRAPAKQRVATALAAADDARVSDAALAAAVAAATDREGELVAAWRERAARGDDALIERLLGGFEHAALAAAHAGELAAFARSLAPVVGRADVFAHVADALSAERAVVREAACAAWLDAAALAAVDDGEADVLVRCAVAIAETGDPRTAGDRDAALAGLARCDHPGARRALFDAIRHAQTEHNQELRAAAYRGIGRVHHPDAMAFLVERMFVEREAYGALADAIAVRLDRHVHRAIVDTLVARAGDADALHAAALYVDVLVSANPSPRMVVELARAVQAWSPRTNDDTRRLRHVLEQAVVAALAIGQPPDARAFLARAGKLAVTPYSDFHVKEHDRRTPAPLGDAAMKTKLAALQSGALDRELAVARADADAARAKGKPVAADDAKLGALAGCTVAARIAADKKTRETWFHDASGTLYVYDGYAIVPPPCTITHGAFRAAITGTEIADWLGDAARIDERVVVLPRPRARTPGPAREVLRLGDRVLVFEQTADGDELAGAWPVEPIGLGFADEAAARRVFALLAANPPTGSAIVEPWQVRRTYVLPGGRDVASLAIAGAEVDARTPARYPPIARAHAGVNEAIAAAQQWELAVLHGGGRIASLARAPEPPRSPARGPAAPREQIASGAGEAGTRGKRRA
jgi:hypothetical protein